MIRAAFVPLLACACTAATHPPAPKPAPSFASCLPRPMPLPVIATVEQLRTRHDALDKLYLDCSARLRRNVEEMK